MNKWKTSTLGDVATVITGPFGSQLHKSDYVKEGIALIMPQYIGERTVDFNGIAYISEDDANRLSRYRVQENDIVYSRRGDVEKHAFITESLSGALCGTGCLRVRFKSDEVYPEFISLYLNRPETKKWIRQHVVGSSMPNLNSGILSDIPISYPSKDTQISFANILINIDRKIEINNRIIAELEGMAKTIYNYWFMKFDFPNAEGKPYQSSGGEMVWNEQLKKEIPKEWSNLRIDQICRITSGYPFDSDSYSSSGKYRIITIKNVQDSGINIDVDNYVNALPPNIPVYCIIKETDILMSLTGNVGRVGLMYAEDCLLNQRVAKIEPFKEDLRGFIYFLFKSSFLRNKMEHVSTGTSQKNLSPIDTGTIRIPYHEEIVCNYSRIANSTIQSIVCILKENLELTKLRDWLLPMLMNGQVTIE